MSQQEKRYPMTDEEKEAIHLMCEAVERDDWAAALEHGRKIKPLPESLMNLKKWFGADYVRSVGFSTELADELYGPGWLDK